MEKIHKFLRKSMGKEEVFLVPHEVDEPSSDEDEPVPAAAAASRAKTMKFQDKFKEQEARLLRKKRQSTGGSKSSKSDKASVDFVSKRAKLERKAKQTGKAKK